jgi:hypothetical protein
MHELRKPDAFPQLSFSSVVRNNFYSDVNVASFSRTARRNGCRSSRCASYYVPTLITTGMRRQIFIRLHKTKFHVYPFRGSRGVVIRGQTYRSQMPHSYNFPLQTPRSQVEIVILVFRNPLFITLNREILLIQFDYDLL